MVSDRFVNLIRVILLVMLAGLTGESLAVHSEHYKVANGVGIYLGIIPTEMIRGEVESTMHGGTPSGGRHHHVMIAVFDNNSGKRIENAEVEATVRELGLSGQRKRRPEAFTASTSRFASQV
jgi:hypothetical protein